MNERKMHPQKMLVWIAVGSIIMMFAGFTSAYIVQKAQKNWYDIAPPTWFYISTISIIASSLLIVRAKKLFQLKKYKAFRQFLILAFIAGLLFVVFQILGFGELRSRGLLLAGDNIASSFMYIIVGLHALHVIGGLIAFIFVICLYTSKKVLYYSEHSLTLFSIYWHFVDILWIYLLIFFLLQLT